MRRARRNPPRAWFRRLQMPSAVTSGDAERFDWILDQGREAAYRLDAIARQLEPQMGNREKRRAAAMIATELAVLYVLARFGSSEYVLVTYGRRWRGSYVDAQAELDELAARVGAVLDAEVETLYGRWRGALRVTRVMPWSSEIESQRDRLAYYVEQAETEADRTMAWRELHGVTLAVEVLRDLLVRYDDETRDGFDGLYDAAGRPREDPIGPLRVRPRPWVPGSPTMGPEQIAARKARRR